MVIIIIIPDVITQLKFLKGEQRTSLIIQITKHICFTKLPLFKWNLKTHITTVIKN